MLELDTGEIYEFRPRLCLDATELGDLLPLARLEYFAGSDSNSLTGEAHAPAKGDRENVQDFTYPFVVELQPHGSFVAQKPEHYDRFVSYGKFSFQGYKMFEETDDTSASGHQRRLLPFWHYRRLLAGENFADGAVPHDIAMINWDSNDLRGENIIDQTGAVQSERLALGKLVSLGFLHWLQTEAPRDDGGKGYPELMLRSDLLGTGDGLSKFPYIREARRVHAKKMIREEEIVAATNAGARAQSFDDSVGIGLYPVDIHGKQEVPGAGQATKPFQIPLAALIPAQDTNVFPACKNIGTTHITNGAYRLHPVEWAIGEAQGALARLLLNKEIEQKHLFRPD
ncbi:MAG: FAD-dependent oxidoreductase, partial [Terriglobales bacterium]